MRAQAPTSAGRRGRRVDPEAAASPGGSAGRRARRSVRRTSVPVAADAAGEAAPRSRAWLATARRAASAQATSSPSRPVAALRGQRRGDVGERLGLAESAVRRAAQACRASSGAACVAAARAASSACVEIAGG